MAAVNDVYRVAMRMLGPSGQDFMNVFHAQISNYVTGTDDDVADELAFIAATHYQDLEDAISNTQTSVDISVQNVTTGAVLGTRSWSPAFAGTLTGDKMPPQTSLYSYFRTGLSKRIGRKFWGVVNEASQDNGLASALVTIVSTFIAHWLGIDTGATTGNSYIWGIYNDNLAPAFAQFIEAVWQARLRTQRRRLPGIGS